MGSGRSMVSNSPAQSLDEIGLSVLQDITRIFELVKLDSGAYKQQFFF